MEINEDDDFADDKFAAIHDIDEGFSDDAMEEEDENAGARKKVKNTITTTTTSRKRDNDEMEVLDTTGEVRKRQPLIEKYRPNSLDEVVAQDDIVQTITRLMEKNALPHLLLYGPPGTGKT
jgi:replication-associated recombination protein RarA